MRLRSISYKVTVYSKANDKLYRWKLMRKSGDKAQTGRQSYYLSATHTLVCTRAIISVMAVTRCQYSDIMARTECAASLWKSFSDRGVVTSTEERRYGGWRNGERSARQRIKSRKTRVMGGRGRAALIRFAQPLCDRLPDRAWARWAPWPSAVNRAWGEEHIAVKWTRSAVYRSAQRGKRTNPLPRHNPPDPRQSQFLKLEQNITRTQFLLFMLSPDRCFREDVWRILPGCFDIISYSHSVWKTLSKIYRNKMHFVHRPTHQLCLHAVGI